VFYLKHGIKLRAVSFIYQQSLKKSRSPILHFSLILARMILDDKIIVYFDESSFNLWMRGNRTWTPKDFPIKWSLNQNRGQGITVMGAISTKMNRPLFMQAGSTNKLEMLRFLPLLKKEFPSDEKVYVVLDNHPSHHTKEVTELAKNLGLELMFMPPYSPELNSIEALWSVLKRSVKSQLIMHKLVNLTQR
jgi:transposase